MFDEKSTIEDLNKNIMLTESIYDFVVYVFLFLDQLLHTRIKQLHSEFLEKGDYSKINKEAKKLIQLSLRKPDMFAEVKESWLKMIDVQKGNHKIGFCFDTLVIFDENANELCNFDDRIMIELGPLNGGETQQYAKFFSLSNYAFQKHFIENQKLRKGRNYLNYDMTGIHREFKNFTVINTNVLGEFLPTVHKYRRFGNLCSAINNSLKVRLFPFYKTDVFDCKIDREKKLFDLSENEYFAPFIADGYIKALSIASTDEVDIVVFPELSLNSITLQEIKEHAKTNPMAFQNIKLIFTGSVWNNGQNIAYILSGNGTVLLETHKREPYEMYDKELGLIAENLKEKTNDLPFLDVEGIGRISYSICRDFTDSNRNTSMFSRLGVNLAVVSAYTNSTTGFIGESERLASSICMVTLMSNYCAAVAKEEKQQQVVGIVTIPLVDGKKKIDAHPILFQKGECGFCDNCEMSFCYKDYVFRKEEYEIYKADTMKGMKIIY